MKIAKLLLWGLLATVAILPMTAVAQIGIGIGIGMPALLLQPSTPNNASSTANSNNPSEIIDDQQDYRKELSWGLNFNTQANIIGGLAMKYSWAAREGQYNTLGFDAVNVKAPKELTVTNRNSLSPFTPYKLNYMFAFRPYYAREFVLFRKAPERGVQLNAVLGAGPSIAFTKPYYIIYDEGNSQARSVPYDPNRHQNLNLVLGSGSFFDGFDKMTPTFGAHAKLALSFEFGIAGNVFGIEGGITAESYSRTIPIMVNTPNTANFQQAYFTLFYGTKWY